MITLDFDQIPQCFINTSLTDKQKDTISLEYYVYKTIDPSKNLAPQFKEISEQIIDMGSISISHKGIKRLYYKNK